MNLFIRRRFDKNDSAVYCRGSRSCRRRRRRREWGVRRFTLPPGKYAELWEIPHSAEFLPPKNQNRVRLLIIESKIFKGWRGFRVILNINDPPWQKCTKKLHLRVPTTPPPRPRPSIRLEKPSTYKKVDNEENKYFPLWFNRKENV